MEELTKFQRLVLVNQFLILEKLYPERANDYEITREALQAGYPTWYDDDFSYLIFDGLTEKQCKDADDILCMFWDMSNTYDSLEDKSGIDEKRVRFWGFDGNNETEYMGYADYVINKKSRYSGLIAQNSHRPTLGTYRRMLMEWQKSENKYNLTKDDLIRITESAIHPDFKVEKS
jgi:uncharacterized protein